MRPVYSVPFGGDFVMEATRFILGGAADLSQCAVVFPGKRPALYMRRALAELIRRPFYPPRFFSMEEFIRDLFRSDVPDSCELEPIDGAYVLYSLIREEKLFRDHPVWTSGFGEFYGWGIRLFNFINELDKEDVPGERLLSVEKNAEIGYDIPDSVNALLMNVATLRRSFHERMGREKRFTAGYVCQRVLRELKQGKQTPFEKVYFTGMYAMTAVERKIVGHLWAEDRAEIIFEGDCDEWPVLRRFIEELEGKQVRLEVVPRPEPSVRIACGFDVHSEVIEAARILGGIAGCKTAVILPSAEMLFPLLTCAIDTIQRPYNISLGYPLARTALFGLISSLLTVQTEVRQGSLYPAAAYVGIITHPFVKNISVDETETRSLLQFIEKSVTGALEEGNTINRPFLNLRDVERYAAESSRFDEYEISLLQRINELFFDAPGRSETVTAMAESIENILNFILEHTGVSSYILSGEMFASAYEILATLKTSIVANVCFYGDHRQNLTFLCDFFLWHLKTARVPFETRPIEEVEIIGMLESRCLSFDEVIILDVNEGILPGPKEIDPLVPLGIYEKLGIPMPEQNEEVFRYYFYRLLGSCRTFHCIYNDSSDRPRSRYLEQIIWAKEKNAGAINVLPVDRTVLPVHARMAVSRCSFEKTDVIMDRLRMKTYSSSVIDRYLRCPVVFLYRDVLALEEPKMISDDVDATTRGQIIHDILRDTFLPFTGKVITKEQYGALEEQLTRALTHHFADKVVTGDYYLFRSLAGHKLKAYLKKTILYGEEGLIVSSLEYPVAAIVMIGERAIKLAGTIDRIDYSPATGRYVVIDYKTGGGSQYPKSIEKTDFASIDDIRRRVSTFQLPIYTHLFSETKKIDVMSIDARLDLLKSNEEDMLFKVDRKEYKDRLMKGFMGGLKTVLGDILNPERSFQPFDDAGCPECPFRTLCHV